MLQDWSLGNEHFFDAGEFRGGLRSWPDILPRDEHVNRLAQRFCGTQSLGGDVIEVTAFNISQNKRRHAITPASFLSFARSSATEPTLTPALRVEGSLVFKIFRRGEASTPKSATVFSAIGFFFAFIMLGSEA